MTVAGRPPGHVIRRVISTTLRKFKDYGSFKGRINLVFTASPPVCGKVQGSTEVIRRSELGDVIWVKGQLFSTRGVTIIYRKSGTPHRKKFGAVT